MTAKHEKEEMELMEYVVKIHLLFNSVSKALYMIMLKSGLMMNHSMQEVT
jgi:hypothetical protein